MKEKSIESEDKSEPINKDMNELQSKLKERQNFISRFIDHLKFVTFDVNYILFGTHLIHIKEIRIVIDSKNNISYGFRT